MRKGIESYPLPTNNEIKIRMEIIMKLELTKHF